MTIYTVINKEKGYREDFIDLRSAKKAMKENEAIGLKTKVYSDGEWIPCGEITLKGSNKIFIANSNMKKPNY